MSVGTGLIAFQGELGAYSHQAAAEAHPDLSPLPCPTFEEALSAVANGRADLGMIAVENSTYGRVADVHQLLPGAGLSVIGEHFVRVHINLLARPGTQLSDIRRAVSHTVLLGQCRGFLGAHGIAPITGADTAGSARTVAEGDDPSLAALASPLAGQIHGLEVLAAGIEDNPHNTTRFLQMARTPLTAVPADRAMTAFLFRVRNIPAALYKAMGGFATNGVNMTKLESYQLGGTFSATQFYAEIEGHEDDPAVIRAMEELDHFTSEIRVLGCFPAARPRVT